MTILGIETSCDETAASIVEKIDNALIVKSNVVASSFLTHQPTGGIIPENAAREQLKYILPVITQALSQANLSINDIDALAVTYGPGLIGSLLVGVETAKTLAMILEKPIVPINHMVGHIYANWLIEKADIQFPAIVLVVSGGHTDLLLMKAHGDFTLLGGTRDDAAGEAFDKIGRLLGFAYPAGPMIEEKAKLGDPKRFQFPRPLIGSEDYDFSFSGLKTAVLREVKSLTTNNQSLTTNDSNDICTGVQVAITDVLIKKTLKAAKEHTVSSILLSGGVAANQTLKITFEQKIKDHLPTTKLFVPTKNLCTDNAAMIAAAAACNYQPQPWNKISADPELYFD